MRSLTHSHVCLLTCLLTYSPTCLLINKTNGSIIKAGHLLCLHNYKSKLKTEERWINMLSYRKKKQTCNVQYCVEFDLPAHFLPSFLSSLFTEENNLQAFQQSSKYQKQQQQLFIHILIMFMAKRSFKKQFCRNMSNQCLQCFLNCELAR